MRILHLSDFHFRKEGKQNQRQSSLVQAIVNHIDNVPPIDLIVFSGDLVDNGSTPGAFEQAFNLLLRPILDKAGLPDNRVYFCAGNHDIDRTQVLEGIFAQLFNNVKQDPDYLIEYSNLKNKEFEISIKPSGNYNSFVKTARGENIESDIHSHLYHAHSFSLGDKKIGVVSINTAWSDVGVKSHNGLLYPVSILEEAINAIGKVDFKILLHHHPLSDFFTSNQYNLEDVVHNNFDLVLLGHRHKVERSILYSANGGILRIMCPASLSGDNGAQIGCSIIEIDDAIGRFKIFTHLYDSKNALLYDLPVIDEELPGSEERKKQNRFRLTIRKRLNDEKEAANLLLVNTSDDEGQKGFNELFTEPVLKSKSTTEIISSSSALPDFLISDFYACQKHFLVAGSNKCGKTSLLRKIQIDCLQRYEKISVIPIYIDAKALRKTGKKLELVDLVYSYYEMNKASATKLINEGTIIVLVDNAHELTGEMKQELVRWCDANSNLKLLLTEDNSMQSELGATDFELDVPLERLYFHRLRKKHIKQLTRNMYNLPRKQEDAIVERISTIFKQMSIPFNFWTVSLFLWIFKKDMNNSLQNDVDLISLYIEKLLEKERLTIDKSPFGYEKFKRYLAFMASDLLLNHKDETYSYSYSELVSFTKNYLERNPRNSANERDVIEYIEEKGVIAKRADGRYHFRLNGVFEYFIAVYMTINDEFREGILNDDALYLSFSNEFELFAGFKRSDEEFLEKVHKRTLDIFKPVLPEGYSRSTYDADSALKSMIVEAVDIKRLVDKITERMDAGISPEEQDRFEEEVAKTDMVDDRSTVKPKGIFALDQSYDALEKSLFILGRVYRNTDEIDNTALVGEMLDDIVNMGCIWGFRLLDEFKTNDLSALLSDEGGEEAVKLLQLLSNVIPTLVQVRLNEMIGHKNMENVLKSRVAILERDFDKNQYKLFLMYYLLCDIDVHSGISSLEKFVKRVKIPMVKYSSLLKLNYYLGFKSNDDKDLALSLRRLIQSQQLNLNNQINMGEFHKGLEKTESRSRRRS